MRRYWRILALGIGAYLLILLLTFPAGRAARYLEQQVAGLALQVVSGSIYSGRAEQLVIQGVPAGAIDWTLKPAALLLGRLEYNVRLDGKSLRGSGIIGTGLGSRLFVHDVRANINPAFLLGRFSSVPLQPTGKIRLTIDTLRFSEAFPDELYGHMSWKDAGLHDPVQISLGQVEMVLGSTGDSLTGNISNASGDVAVSGEVSLQSSGQYNLRLQLTPGTTTPPEFAQLLDAYGQRLSGGSYLLKESGRW